MVAHDLKAPLNGIASLVDFVVEDYADRLDDEGRDQLRLIQTMATRGVAMVDALRQFARIASAPLSPRTLDIGALAVRVAASVAARLPEVTLEAAIATAVPPVVADPALVPVLLDRLLMNAAQFGDSPIRHVTFAAAGPVTRPVPDGHVVFVVRDDGIGIPERYREAVLDMFKRLHAADKFGGGVGAGLALARAVVERHGGVLWIEAIAGRGSAVFFTLPGTPAAALEA